MLEHRVKLLWSALAVVAAVAAVLFAYRDALSAGFVFDDHLFFQQLCWQVESTADLLAVPWEAGCTYRPIRFLSLAVDHVLWGPDPFGFHLTNLVLHGSMVVLVYLLLRRLELSVVAAVLGALLWGLHPVHTDVVTYVAGRRDLLSTLFFLLALWAWPRHPKNRIWAAVGVALTLLLFYLAFQSKEMAVTLPAVIVLEAVFSRTLTATAHGLETRPSPWSQLSDFVKKHIPGLALIVGLAAVGFAYRAVIKPLTLATDRLWGGDLFHHILTIPVTYAKYLELVVFPWRLYGDYSDYPPASGLGDPRVWIGLLVLGAVWIGGISQSKRRPYLSFGLLWFGVTMLPVSQIVPHHELLAEHYLYLPMVGLAVPIARGLDLATGSRRRLTLVAVAVAIVAVVFGARIHDRNQDFVDEPTFAQAILRHVPDSIRARLTLAHGLQSANRLDEALAPLQWVLDHTEPPSRFHRNAVANLITTNASLGNLDEAASLAFAMRRDYPDDPYPIRMLGTIRARQGLPEKGLVYQLRAREMAPRDVEGRLHLGVTLLRLGRLDEAAVELETVATHWRRNPDAQAMWGVVAFEQGDLEVAEQRLLAALELDPHHRQALEHLFLIYQRRGDTARACATFFALQAIREDLAEMNVSECDQYRLDAP